MLPERKEGRREGSKEGGDDALVKSPTYLRARVLLDIGRTNEFGHDDISHEGVTSAKRAAITQECRKFTTLTLGGTGAGGAGDQPEREINKIQIDSERRLFPHSTFFFF